MKYKDMAITAIAIESAPEFSYISRCLYPTLRFQIKFAKFLKLSILAFIQKLNTHSGCEINSVTGRVNPVLFSFILPFFVVTDTSAAIRAFG